MQKMMGALLALLCSGGLCRAADYYCAAGNVDCLVAAIKLSNANGEDNFVFLEPGSFTLKAVDNTTDGASGLPPITGRLTIRGPEGIGTTIERDPAAPSFRIFNVAAAGHVNLEWLGIRNGMLATVDSPQRLGGAAVFNRGTLYISRSAIYNNTVDLGGMQAGGGAIESFGPLAVSHTEIRANHALGDSHGAGIIAHASLLIEDSLLFGNIAGDTGALATEATAAILRTTISGNQGSNVAGIANGGTLLVENSTIRQNIADSGGEELKFGVMSVVGSTISENSSTGGGIYNSGDAVLKNVTMILNVSTGAGPAGLKNSGTLRLVNTILAFNALSDGTAADCDQFTSLGSNIVGNLNGCTFPIRGTDIFGDPSLTPYTEDSTVYGSGHFSLSPASAAVDAGSNSACTPLDQIGEKRHGTCDIGSVEYPSASVTANGFAGFLGP